MFFSLLVFLPYWCFWHVSVCNSAAAVWLMGRLMVSSPLLQLMCVSSHVLALVLGSLSMVLCCVQLFGVSVQFNHFHLIIFISFGCSTFIMTGTGYFYCSSTTFCLPCFFCPLPAQLTTVYLLVNLGQVCLLGSSFAADSIIETMAHVIGNSLPAITLVKLFSACCI